MKNKIVIVLVAIAVLGFGAFFAKTVYQKQEVAKVEAVAKEEDQVFLRSYSPRMGEDSAKVKLVEFMDPECESCREFHPFIKMIMKEYEGQVQLIVRYAPFHGNSIMMIKILEASRKQGKYWETLEVLFRTQPQWGSHHEPKPQLVWNYLPEAGVDIEKIKADMNDPQVQANIDQELKDVEKLMVKYTPTFFVNEKPLEDFGYDQLRALIDSELKK